MVKLIFIYILFLSEGQKSEAWEPSSSAVPEIGVEQRTEKYFPVFSPHSICLS
jgi:hypothetical protein